MDFNKVGFTLSLLLCGVYLFGANWGTMRVEASAQFCYADAAYMTCPSSGNERLPPECNCDLAQGCTIYKADGTPCCTPT